MAKVRAPNGQFAKAGSGGKKMAMRMPPGIRKSTTPHRSNRVIRKALKAKS